jgi:peptidoglycan/LPS O-acetylase OafA/YrhL
MHTVKMIAKQYGYFPAFDYLRIATALGVFAYHVDHSGITTEHFGNACVQIFFALSGFLIGGILIQSSHADLARFYFNRTMRIWIPYAIAIFLLLAVTLIKQKLGDLKLWEFYFYFVTFDYNWFGPRQLAGFGPRMPLEGTGNHFWSICVEEQFYLVAPFIVLLMPRKMALAIFSAIFLLNCVYPSWFGSIALGVLLAFSREHFGEWYLTKAGRPALFTILTLAGSLIWFEYLPYASAIPVLATALVALLAFRGPGSEVGCVLGGMSFSFYLNHWVGLFAVNFLNKKVGLSYPTGAAIGLLIALAMAYVHYLYVDSTIANIRTGCFTETRGRAAFATGVGLVSFGAIVGIYLMLHPLT